jgi:hypothetical protein
MESAGAPTRERAVLRLVTATHDDRLLTLDAVVVASDRSERWPTRWLPVALRLELPESRWMAKALGELLVDWAGEDALVEATVVTSPHHTVARLGRADSVVSLDVVPPGVNRTA